LTSEIGIRDGGALDTSPCPAGELPRRRGRAIDHRGDLLERQPEHVVEHAREPLRRGQHVQHGKEREADGIRQQRLLVRLEHTFGGDDGIGDVDAEGLLRRSQASWTASSASASEPSIR
jgi:hypothetical protein